MGPLVRYWRAVRSAFRPPIFDSALSSLAGFSVLMLGGVGLATLRFVTSLAADDLAFLGFMVLAWAFVASAVVISVEGELNRPEATSAAAVFGVVVLVFAIGVLAWALMT